MTYNPKISIVTPTFNSSRYLEETILSVLEQKYKNYEYIIIDGGSTDGTLDIIRKYEKNLTYWISEPDNGMYHAIQKGFDKSTGEIMAWINSDDKYQPGAFQIVSQIFTSFTDVGWIMGMPAYYNKEGLCVKVASGRKWAQSRFAIGDYKWIQQENVFWRRSLWDLAGGYLNANFKYAADFDLWCRFFQYSKLYNVVTPIAGFRLHGDQISLKFKDLYENEVIEINRLFQRKTSIPQIILLLLWNFRKIFLSINIKFTIFLSKKLICLMDKVHQYPPSIYYDFSSNKWGK
jgi:glycosyltransferase involved in cell wall biosynthesis